MHFYENMKEYASFLTNGIVSFEVHPGKHGCYVELGKHILAQDGYNNLYIDGILAHVELREVRR